MMHYLWILTALCWNWIVPQQSGSDDLCGIWLTGTGKAHVRIYKSSNHYFGRIVWLREPKNAKGLDKTDENNPDLTHQKDPLLGSKVLSNFAYKGDHVWEDGTIYDPENGKTYDCIIRMEQQNELKIRGYIGISLIGRTDTWKRVK